MLSKSAISSNLEGAIATIDFRLDKKIGYLHKDLNDYKYEELLSLVTQFTEVWKSKMKLNQKPVLK
jgi:hypothetical protein